MIDPEPLVSIVIPTHNGVRFIASTVRSALAQSYDHLEVIVVDDASSDETAEIVRAIDDPRLTVLRRDRPSGKSAIPRNLGIARSNGALIAPLDHDDLLAPDKIALQVARFTADPTLVLLGGQGALVDPDGTRLGSWSMPTGKRRVLAALRWRCPFVHSAVMYPKAAVEQVGGYDERSVMAQDHALWLRLAVLGDVDNLAEVVCSYRRHTSQITTTRLLGPTDIAVIAEARRSLARGRGESVRAADLRQRVWVLRHAARAFRRVVTAQTPA